MRTMRMERLQPANDDAMGMVEVEVARIEKTSNEVGCMGGCGLGKESQAGEIFFFGDAFGSTVS